jgi:lipid-A-disaccharide synthase-like uncharacterized protein
MDWLTNLFWFHGKFLGIAWSFWKGVGWAGNAIFFSRFFVQWWASERSRRVVIPPLFWWLSLGGSFCLFTYGLHQRDSVFIFAYAFTWIPYVRNLVLNHRTRSRRPACSHCHVTSEAGSRFCQACGYSLNIAQT